jgi:hypothetical protein
MSFNPQHDKFISTLENPNFNVAQQLIRTAGKGRTNGNSYSPPTADVIEKTRALFTALYAFDAAPNDKTFAQVKNVLHDLNMKAVQVAGAPEWIYITPDAEPGSGKWEIYSKKTQFNLSWHVGSNSKVAVSDEHNGGDGAFRVVGELVEQGTNIKLVMSNSRHRGTSKKNASGRFIGDWAHSKDTIDYPIMCDLARDGYCVINIHGMASRTYGLLVNNYGSFFTRDRESLPTMIGIALALYFNDSDNKKFVFGGNLPGSAVINGKRKPLTPPNNEKSSLNSLYRRAKGVHNTNVIGNAVNAINARMNHRQPGDSGRSCHIEFGIVRDGRGDLRKVVAAINLAAFWMNNYKPELNPWTIVKNDPNFDMLKYGDLYHPGPEVIKQLQAIAANNNDTASARIAVPKDVEFDIDLNDAEFNPDFDADDNETLPDDAEFTDEVVTAPAVTLLLSGGPAATAVNPKINHDEISTEPRLAPTP